MVLAAGSERARSGNDGRIGSVVSDVAVASFPARTRRRRAHALAAFVAGTLLLGACGAAPVDVVVADAPVTTATPTSAGGRPSTSSVPASTPTTTDRSTTTSGTQAPRTTTTAARTGTGYQGDLNRMIDDIRSYWMTTFPALYGKPYVDLAGGVIRVTSTDVQVPPCGTTRAPRYRDIAGNAYYCRSSADYIAYDDTGLFPKIQKRYGTISLGLVMAHEWGHAIQARAGVDGSTILLEQQADCFAGAWLASVAQRKPSGVAFDPGALTGAIGGFLSYADPVGVTAQADGAHGSGFDRVGAFQDGYVNGAARCVTYAKSLPPTFALPFTSAADYANGGNLPFDEVEPLMVADLDRFWTAQGNGFTALASTVAEASTVTRCNGTTGTAAATGTVAWCSDTRTVAFDPSFLRQAYQEGDFAVGLLFGHAWAQAAQQARRLPIDGSSALLQADCYAGAWTRSTIAQLPENRNGGGSLSLSPGDLDEGIRTLLTFGPQVGRRGDAAGPFERIAAFRKGVVGGLSACAA